MLYCPCIKSRINLNILNILLPTRTSRDVCMLRCENSCNNTLVLPLLKVAWGKIRNDWLFLWSLTDKECWITKFDQQRLIQVVQVGAVYLTWRLLLPLFLGVNYFTLWARFVYYLSCNIGSDADKSEAKNICSRGIFQFTLLLLQS